MHVLPSAYRHGVARSDILHALRNILVSWSQESGVIIHVGPRRDGALLEIGVILDADGRLLVIHAMLARPKFLP